MSGTRQAGESNGCGCVGIFGGTGLRGGFRDIFVALVSYQNRKRKGAKKSNQTLGGNSFLNVKRLVWAGAVHQFG